MTTDRPTYDFERAHQYIEGLLPDYIRRLQQEGLLPEDVPAQPSIGPTVAQLVDVLILATKPRNVLEIGTSAGYSAIAMGKALRQVGGKLTTVEIDPRLAHAARNNIKEAGLSDIIDVIVNDANLVLEGVPPHFGLILQDGTKDDYLRMLPRLIELLEMNGLLITDDVLFPVMSLPGKAKRYQYALQLYNEALQGRPDMQTVWLPIGDGVAISVKTPTNRFKGEAPHDWPCDL